MRLPKVLKSRSFRALSLAITLTLFPNITSFSRSGVAHGDVVVSLSLDDCRRSLDDCEGRLSRICGEVAAARAALDQALANQSAAASSLANIQAQIQTSARCMADAQG